MLENEFGGLGGSKADASSAFREAAICCVIYEHPEPETYRIAFCPYGDRASVLAVLRVADTFGAVGATDDSGGIMEDPGGLLSFLGAEIIGIRWALVDVEARCADRLGIHFRSGGSDLAAVGVHGREFFRMLAIHKDRLFVTDPSIRPYGRRVVAFCRIGDSGWNRAVQIHSTVELEQDVLRRAIGAGKNRERRSGFHHRHRSPVGE